MDLKLSSLVTDLPRIGSVKAKYLGKLGITHIRDFIYTFPRRYDDFSNITSINELRVGEKMTVKGKVKKVKNSWGFRGKRRMLRIFVDVEDDTGILNVTWYNLQFLAKQLWLNREIYVAGTVEKTKGSYNMRSPVIEFANTNKENTHTGRIVPVYPETYGVSSRFLRYQVKNTLPLLQAIPEYIPMDIIKRNKLMGIHDAIRAVHFPKDTKQLDRASRRIKFDELFFLQLAALVRRQKRQQRKAISVKSKIKDKKQFINQLPFELTNAQLKAIDEILEDISKKIPMNRLLQGDVGSGKSVVALLITHLTLLCKYPVVYLAPTEILARQQADDFIKTLGKEKVRLLIGATKKAEKEEIKQQIVNGEDICVIGTHALLQGDVEVKKVALVIIDEQHRFGVAQRKALQESKKTIPHLLSMTATPIPRTLNLTVYGDLDTSVLNEMPAGRKSIKTSIITPSERDSAILHILKELHAGRQAYVIAPLVEQSEKLGLKSVKETVKEMKSLFPDIAVGMLHGKMSPEEKGGVTRNFSAGALQLLVATSVVEVGINVPNATVMIIEGAERFGLAQLHQFRGRIGRGKHQSYCYLFPTTEESAQIPRLQVLVSTTDGFVIAEKDLKLRGPGEAYGVAQSGFSGLQVASLLDYSLIKLARKEAEQVLSQDPLLKSYPILKGKVQQKNLMAHFE